MHRLRNRSQLVYPLAALVISLTVPLSRSISALLSLLYPTVICPVFSRELVFGFGYVERIDDLGLPVG